MRSFFLMNIGRGGQRGHQRFVWSLIALVALIAATLATAPAAFAQEPPARNFFGTIVSIEDNVIQVITKDGDLLDITVSDDTAIVLPLKSNAALTDLVGGDVVAISLTDDESPLVADKIFVVSTQTKYKHIPGEVIEKTDTQITIKPLREAADAITFNITPETKINFRRGAIGFNVGSFVIVLAVRDSNTGTLSPHAIEINVASSRRPAPPSQTRPPVEDPVNKAKIRGIFQEIDEKDNWIVNDTRVVVDANTEIESGLVIGQVVEVVGQLLDDGSILAHEIEAVEEVSHVAERLRFEGVFEGIGDDETWIISGTPVIVRRGIDIDGQPSVGQRVRVKAVVLGNGSIVAREIEIVRNISDDDELNEKRLEGTFQGVDENGRWIISQIKVAVDENTELENAPEIGDRVKVKAIILDDGTFLAREIEVEGRDEDRDDARKEVEFRGIIQSVFEEGGTIVGIEVRGHRIRIVELTEVRGALRVGLLAKVEALLMQNGGLIAREIETRKIDIPGIDAVSKAAIRGIIQRMSDDGALIQVNGIVIAVGNDTRVEGDPTVGAPISVEGVLRPDGTVRALFMKVFSIEDITEKIKEKIRGMIDEVIRDDDGNIIGVVVNGRRIRIEALTEIEIALKRGAFVEIEGFLSDGGFLAREVEKEDDADEADESSENQGGGSNADTVNNQGNAPVAATPLRIKFEGVIEAMERRANLPIGFIWVNGHRITVTRNTEIKGDAPTVGSFVEVEARRNGNVIIAAKIEVGEPEYEDDDGDNRSDNSGNGSDSDDKVDSSDPGSLSSDDSDDEDEEEIEDEDQEDDDDSSSGRG